MEVSLGVDLGQWVSAADAAGEMGVSQVYVHACIQKGRLDYAQTPLGKLVSRESLERMKRRRMHRHSMSAARRGT